MSETVFRTCRPNGPDDDDEQDVVDTEFGKQYVLLGDVS